MSTLNPDFELVFICAGNTCRSPMASQIFQAKAEAANLPVTVSSAGVSAQPGEPMSSQAIEALTQLGYATKAHKSQKLNSLLGTKANLVLTATQEQKLFTIASFPESQDHVFTMHEFVSLITRADTQTDLGNTVTQFLEQRIEQISALRNLASVEIDIRDIEDPIGLDSFAYLETAKEIEELVTAIVNWMAK